MEKNFRTQQIETLFAERSITLNGPNACDPQTEKHLTTERLISRGLMSLGETYVSGDWHCEKLDEFFKQLFYLDQQNSDNKLVSSRHWLHPLKVLFKDRTANTNLPSLTNHFDLGNEFFKLLLDSQLNYSAGYWRASQTLEDAQQAKHALICGKLRIRPGMRILDLGCGWGGFSRYVASHYKATVLGTTLSSQQADYAKSACRDLPVDIQQLDFKSVTGTFDRIVCLGMMEHLNQEQQAQLMQHASTLLTKQGLMLIQTIGANYSDFPTPGWIKHFIFPDLTLPSIAEVGKISEKYFVIEDWHNLGTDYGKTMQAWLSNLNHHWPAIQALGFDDRFKRLWEFYLNLCCGAFHARVLQTWQCVFSKIGGRESYDSVR